MRDMTVKSRHCKVHGPYSASRGILTKAAAIILMLGAFTAGNRGLAQTDEGTVLSTEARKLSSDILRCFNDGTHSDTACGETFLPRLRQIRAQINVFARNNPQPGAVWTRDAGRLDASVDKAVQNPQKPNLLDAVAQLQAVSQSLPVQTKSQPGRAAASSGRPIEVKTEKPPASWPRIPAKPIAGEEGGYSFTTVGEIEAIGWNAPAPGQSTTRPEIRLRFLIRRDDKRPFDGQLAKRIDAHVEGEEGSNSRDWPVTIGPADLVTSTPEASSAMLLLDMSGSMSAGTDTANAHSVDKLSAAKSAIGDFLERLQPADKVGIMAFDEQPWEKPVFSLSADKSAARAAVDAVQVTYPGANYTGLYDAIQSGVRKARELGVHNVVILTDGMEDTPHFRSLSEEQRRAEKSRREKQIGEEAAQNGIYIYSVGIGNRAAQPAVGGDTTNLPDVAFVDCDTLDHISGATHAGKCHYIDMPELARTSGNSAEYHSMLAERISGILTEIGKTFHFDYSLTLRLDPQSLRKDGRSHKVDVNFNLEDARLTASIPYVWDVAGGETSFGPPVVRVEHFYKTNKIPVGTAAIIYGFGISVLALLAIPHWLMNLIADMEERRAVRKAVKIVARDSLLIGKECPNEERRTIRDLRIREGDAVIICPNPDCGRVYHLSCWHGNGDKCWVRVCPGRMKLDEAVLKAHGIHDESGVSA